jgi:hypothetical protein
MYRKHSVASLRGMFIVNCKVEIFIDENGDVLSVVYKFIKKKKKDAVVPTGLKKTEWYCEGCRSF